MNILLTNDDGIYAKGINVFGEMLATFGTVYLCAPSEEKSACGHGITINDVIEVVPIKIPWAAKAFAVKGTPVDCVKIALELLEKEKIKIDLVCSGINHGGNLGTDTLYSGTVSAAIEGALCSKPSIAVSLDGKRPQSFEFAAKIALEIIKKAVGKQRITTVLNINVPDIPIGEIKGVKVTELGIRKYAEWFEESSFSKEKKIYKYMGLPIIKDVLPANVDVQAHHDGYVTITPIQFNLTDYGYLNQVEEWVEDKLIITEKGD